MPQERQKNKYKMKGKTKQVNLAFNKEELKLLNEIRSYYDRAQCPNCKILRQLMLLITAEGLYDKFEKQYRKRTNLKKSEPITAVFQGVQLRYLTNKIYGDLTSIYMSLGQLDKAEHYYFLCNTKEGGSKTLYEYCIKEQEKSIINELENIHKKTSEIRFPEKRKSISRGIMIKLMLSTTLVSSTVSIATCSLYNHFFN